MFIMYSRASFVIFYNLWILTYSDIQLYTFLDSFFFVQKLLATLKIIQFHLFLYIYHEKCKYK